MGYFPNGTSGEIFEANVCAKCVHEGNCAVWDLHLFKNYDQLKDGQEQLRDALNMLIPDDTVECKMFVEIFALGQAALNLSVSFKSECRFVWFSFHINFITPRGK